MKKLLFLLATFSLILAACGGASVPESDSGKLNVVATTSIVADVVSNIGGEHVNVEVLLPVGTDPHSFEPTPQDISKVANADIVFANGAGLEAFIEHLLESAEANDKIVEVSEGIDLLAHPKAGASNEHDHAEDHDEGEEGEEHDDHNHVAGDPHVWVDPNNVMLWVDNIEHALTEADPAHAAEYAANAESYQAQLTELDTWIRQQVANIPPENRKLVTDHMLFGYFADEYGFKQIGALIPGYSTLAEPSAQELAAIEDAIREYNVPAVFVGNTVNPALGGQVAEDTGIKLVTIYTGSLSDENGDAPTYLDYIRYNVTAFVNALK